MGDVLFVATVVGLTPSALLSTNSPNISTMPSWLNAGAVLKFAVSRQFGLRVMRVKEVQPHHVSVPLIVRLVRLGGMVKEVKEVQLHHVLPPLIVRLVRFGGMVKEVRDEQFCHVLAPAMVSEVCVVRNNICVKLLPPATAEPKPKSLPTGISIISTGGNMNAPKRQSLN